MEIKDGKKKFVRPIDAEDLEKVEMALKGASEGKAMNPRELADVRKTVDLVKKGTNQDVINQIIVLILLLKSPELKAIQFAIGKHTDKLEMIENMKTLRKILKKRGITDIKGAEEVLKDIEA